MCIISTAPTAKFGATIPPTPFSLHAVSILSMPSAGRPVVPTTGEAPDAIAASAMWTASDGREKSTSARGRCWWRNAAMSSPRARPPTYSIPGSLASAAARIEPTLPWCPATATRIGSFMCACLSVSARAAPSPAAVAASAVAPAETTFPRRRWRGKGSGHHLWVDVLLDRQTRAGQLFDRCLAAEVEAALAVDLDRLDHYLVADVAYLFHAFDAVVRELGDVHQAVLVGQHLYEGAERHDPDHLAFVDPANLHLVGQALDPVDRLLTAFLVDRRDEHATVVLDIDLGARLLGDLADHLASGADDVADLVGVDEDGRDAWRVSAHLATRPRQDGQHLVEHEEARFASLLERLRKYLVGQALDLDIHLQRSDAVAGAGDLEVHVAEVVFDSLNVCEHSMLAFACDQAHGDAGHR